jgi:hypothetical protein
VTLFSKVKQYNSDWFPTKEFVGVINDCEDISVIITKKIKNQILYLNVTMKFKFVIITHMSGRPRRRWLDNIKMDLGERGWDGRDLIELAQDRDQWRALVNMVMNLRIP